MSHTKILINRRFPRFSVKSPNIGGDLVGVDVSFRSFLCAKENGHVFASFSTLERSAMPLATAGTQESKKNPYPDVGCR